MGGGNAKDIFALINYDWLNQDVLDTPVKRKAMKRSASKFCG